jgi:hypothetical protein
MMVTRYFDEPIPVHYRADSEWKRVLALGVRRSGKRYEVLIVLATGDEATDTAWVSRSRIRVEDPAMLCGVDYN